MAVSVSGSNRPLPQCWIHQSPRPGLFISMHTLTLGGRIYTAVRITLGPHCALRNVDKSRYFMVPRWQYKHSGNSASGTDNILLCQPGSRQIIVGAVRTSIMSVAKLLSIVQPPSIILTHECSAPRQEALSSGKHMCLAPDPRV